MKKYPWYKIGLFGWLCTLSLCAQATLVKSGDLVVVAGDSITEQKQYSVLIEDYILMCAPLRDMRVIQFGWSGDTANGFVSRQIPSLKLFKPQVVTTLFGMNDGRYTTLSSGVANLYRQSMTTIVQTLKQDGARELFVGTPGIVGRNEYRKPGGSAEVYNETLRQLGEIGKEVAAAEGAHWVDVHSLMAEVEAKVKEKYGEKYHLAGPDGVHPSANGHLVMAYAFLKAMGFDGDIGTITVDMGKGTATASEGHEILGVENGGVKVRSSRYPFCFYGKSEDPNSNKGVLEFLPFNQELNRFLLVVKDAPTATVKVTWGEASREFSREELSKGVNLAEAFLDKNPFSDAFAKVNQKAKVQQDFETPAVKVLLQSFVEFQKQMPELAQAESDSFARLGDGVLKRSEELCAQTAAAMRPVEHTIVLEPVR